MKVNFLESLMMLWVDCYITGNKDYIDSYLLDFKNFLYLVNNIEDYKTVLEFDRNNGNFITDKDLDQLKMKILVDYFNDKTINIRQMNKMKEIDVNEFLTDYFVYGEDYLESFKIF